MKTIASWGDLAPHGIIPLTGEACGLVYRILFDVTERGRKVIGTCLGIPDIRLPEPWNRGPADDPHVGCIMLSPEMRIPLSVFALLEGGCKEAYLMGDVVVGIEESDPPDAPETMRRVYGVEYVRRFGYWGTAGDRNVHLMTGRVI
jgi:hypothetical protein